MLSCHLRILSVDDGDGDEGHSDTDASLTDDIIQDTLLESLSIHGLVRDIKLSKFSARSASFTIQMARESEALRASERLNGTSLPLPRSNMAVVKAVYGGPRINKVKITFDQPPISNSQVTAVRRRFACCGPIRKADIEGDSIIMLVFEDAYSALRAIEDYRERGGLEKHPSVDLMLDELVEKDADKKRHRVPSEAGQVGLSLASDSSNISGTKSSMDAAAPKRSRDVVGMDESVSSVNESLGTLKVEEGNKESKRSRDDGESNLGSAHELKASESTILGDEMDRHTPTPSLLHDEPSLISTATEMTASTPSTMAASVGMTSSDPAAFLAAATEGRQLFVVHAKNAEVDEITALFEDKLGYETMEVKRTKRSGLRGMTFVTFASHEHAKKALEELHGKEFPPGSDTKLKVMFAQAWDESKRTARNRSSTPNNNHGLQHPNLANLSPRLEEESTTSFVEGAEQTPVAMPQSAETKLDDKHSNKTGVSGNKSQKKRNASAERGDSMPFKSAVSNSAFSVYSPQSQPSYRGSSSGNVSAEFQLEQELAARTNPSADALAETFGSVVGFVPGPPPPWMTHPMQHQTMNPHGLNMAHHHPHLPPLMSGYAPYSYGPVNPHPSMYPSYDHQSYGYPFAQGPSQAPPPFSVAQQSISGSLANLPDASRLHVIFGKPLPEEIVHQTFDAAAPGLQYVSRHKDKPFAFVKYGTSASAMLAMVRLHGSMLMGQKLRVTLADPPPSDSSSRKRQRDVLMQAQHGAQNPYEDEVEDEAALVPRNEVEDNDSDE